MPDEDGLAPARALLAPAGCVSGQMPARAKPAVRSHRTWLKLSRKATERNSSWALIRLHVSASRPPSPIMSDRCWLAEDVQVSMQGLTSITFLQFWPPRVTHLHGSPHKHHTTRRATPLSLPLRGSQADCQPRLSAIRAVQEESARQVPEAARQLHIRSTRMPRPAAPPVADHRPPLFEDPRPTTR